MDCTVLIITRDAEDTLARTLKSVIGWAQHCVVVDDFSRDATGVIAQEWGCRLVRHHAANLGVQRAFALSQVIAPWTLVLDSDEVLTDENKKEIEQAMRANSYEGYYLPFRNHLFGKKLMHGELHKKLVLFKTHLASIPSQEVHETYTVKGKLGELRFEILHYSYRSILQIIRKFFYYSLLQAKEYKKASKKYGLRELFLNPLHMFYKRFIGDEGYKDGLQRMFLDYEFAHMEFLSYFLIPFVTIKKRISVDCGSYPVGGNVESGIHRLLQGIHAQKDETNEYYWFSFHSPSSYHVPRRFYAQVWLPLFTLLHRCDVFLGIGGTIPWLLHFFRLKKILFLHDFGFFTSPDKYSTTAQKLQKQTERSIRWTDRIIVFHEEIYTEFMKRYPSFIYKVELIPAGADHLASISQQPVFVEPARPFILYVGVVKPVKRIEKILSAVGSTYTVIAGPQEQAYKQTLAIGKNQHVQFIKNFNDGQLKWLYQQASVLVYTSEHEGFCYPVLEALSLGLPVIALDLPLFREYKKHFPHLTLAQSTDEMKRELEKINTFKTVTVHHNPYTWSQFALCLKNVMDPQTDINQAHQKTAFIVVLYKTSHEEKKRLAREIESLHVPQYKIYWIDNSTNGKGYAAGVNEGVRAGLRDSCDYFIALNPDISLAVTLGETMLFSAQVFDVWGYTMLQENKAFYGGEIEKWRLSGGLISKKPKTRFAPVDFVSGSLIGFSKQVIQTIGLWDERYFMYYEDVDYCVRARKAGFQVGIDSGIIYRHFELSTHNKKKSEWISRSRWHFFWRNANGLQKIRELIRLPKTILLHS